MPEFRVSHVIDVIADNPHHAAEAARAAQVRAGTLATVFQVTERLPGAAPQRYARPVEVDLEPGDTEKLLALMNSLTRADTARCGHASATLRPVDLCPCGAILAEGVELELATVGMPDPTPKHVDAHCLMDCHPAGECTWEAGHEGQHVAGDGEIVVGITDAGSWWAPGSPPRSYPGHR